jgi:hypothetical protein
LKTILLFSFILLCKLNISAQTTVLIEGSVKSNTEQKLVGANISFVLDKKEYHTATDSLGEYSINLPLGAVSIEVSYFGIIKNSLKTEIVKNTRFDFELEQIDNTLSEVVISNESKKALSIAQTGKLSFNTQKLSSVPSMLGTTDVIRLLQLTPGVQNSGDANGYLYVRGGDPGHNLMLYADAPIYGMSHLLGIFPFYNANHIQEIQFDKSNLDAKHGGRLSSTVYVKTFKQLPKALSIQGNVGLLASQITASIPIGNGSGLYISGRRTYVDEIVAALLNSNKKKEGSETHQLKYHFSDCNLTFISKISEKNLFTIDAFLSGDKLEINDQKSNLNSGLKWGNLAISTAWNYQISKETSIKNSLYFTRYDNTLNILQGTVKMDISSYIQDLGYTNSIQYSIKKIQFETGLEYSTRDLQPQKIAVSNIGIDDIDKRAIAIRANNISIFTSSKFKFTNNLFAKLGLRLNYYTSGSKNSTFLHFEPRIEIHYLPKNDFSFFASYTRQHQYLNLITTSSVGIPTDFWIASSDGIPSQSSNEFSIGSNQNITNQFKSIFSGYYREMFRLLEYPYGATQFNEISTLKNDLLVGNGKSYGLEWMLKKDDGKFKGWISYTLSWSNRQFAELNNGNSYFAKYDRRHNISLVSTFDFNSKWSVGLTQVFSSGNHFTIPTSWYFINNNPVKEYNEFNNAQLPNYIRTDLSINYYFYKTAKKESALNFSVFNVFNISNPIFTVVNVIIDKEKENVIIKSDNKTLYKILPSVSWRFKF